MKYVYMLSGDERERDMALAEARALADARPCSAKLVEAERRIDIGRAAYALCGLELIASGPDLDAACRELADTKLASDDFAIEVRRIPRKLKIGHREVANALALVIDGRPNLDHPAESFLALVTADGVWFGRKLPAAEPGWRRFVRKPYDCSSALPAHMARAVCNLVVRGGERVVDPCCGSGSLLLHAAELGADVTGFDISKAMVGSTNKNLEHYGYAGQASLGDATQIRGSYDVVLTNLPYGIMSPVTESTLRKLVHNIVRLAPRGVLIAARDTSADIREGGAVPDQVIRLPKFSMTRFVVTYERQ